MASRLNVQFDNKLTEALNEIAKQKGLTKAEVIRRAISVYSALGKELETGDNQLAITNNNHIVKQLIMP